LEFSKHPRVSHLGLLSIGGGAMFTDLEIRIFSLQQDAGYPVEMTLGAQQEFPRGYLAEEIVPWLSSGDLKVDGQRLFEALFADAALRGAWAEARGQEPQRRVRLRIAPDAAELHALPWELLYDNDVMLSASDATPVSRYLPIALPWGGGDKVTPLRVLVVIANPANLQADYDLAQLDVATERAVLEEGLQDCGDAVELVFMAAPVTLERLEEELRAAAGYHILHYVGHGAFSRRRAQAALYMEDDSGQVSVVTDDALVGMLARLPKSGRPRLIFLAACHSAVRSTGYAPQVGPALGSQNGCWGPSLGRENSPRLLDGFVEDD